MEEEGDQAEQGNDEANSLPVCGVPSVWFVDISLDDSDEEDPEDAWDEVLDRDAPVISAKDFGKIIISNKTTTCLFLSKIEIKIIHYKVVSNLLNILEHKCNHRNL